MWLSEEVYLNQFGIQLLNPQMLAKLKNAECESVIDAGLATYNYNLLTNPLY